MVWHTENPKSKAFLFKAFHGLLVGRYFNTACKVSFFHAVVWPQEYTMVLLQSQKNEWGIDRERVRERAIYISLYFQRKRERERERER